MAWHGFDYQLCCAVSDQLLTYLIAVLAPAYWTIANIKLETRHNCATTEDFNRCCFLEILKWDASLPRCEDPCRDYSVIHTYSIVNGVHAGMVSVIMHNHIIRAVWSPHLTMHVWNPILETLVFASLSARSQFDRINTLSLLAES